MFEDILWIIGQCLIGFVYLITGVLIGMKIQRDADKESEDTE